MDRNVVTRSDPSNRLTGSNLISRAAEAQTKNLLHLAELRVPIMETIFGLDAIHGIEQPTQVDMGFSVPLGPTANTSIHLKVKMRSPDIFSDKPGRWRLLMG